MPLTMFDMMRVGRPEEKFPETAWVYPRSSEPRPHPLHLGVGCAFIGRSAFGRFAKG